MLYSQSDIDKLKTISCVDYLCAHGYKPTSTTGRTVKFLSPWRRESKASLHIYQSNTWCDFADRTKSGSIIQLVMALEEVSFGEACRILSGEKLPEHKIIVDETPKEPPIRIVYTSKITSPWLIQYLSSRCIPLEVANRFCKQVQVEVRSGDKVYKKTCIGFENLKGGFELRSAKTKLSNSPKYYSLINPGNSKVVVTEGFFNMLSYFTLYGEKKDETYVVLNSASNASYVDWGAYASCDYWGDLDAAGNKVMAQIQEVTKVTDYRKVYVPHNDLNKYLVEQKSDKLTLYSKCRKLIM